MGGLEVMTNKCIKFPGVNSRPMAKKCFFRVFLVSPSYCMHFVYSIWVIRYAIRSGTCDGSALGLDKQESIDLSPLV